MKTHVVGQVLVFNEHNELLLLRRSKNDTYAAGGFDLPGGQINAGEELLIGAARELAEETGIHLQTSELHCVYATMKHGLHTDLQQMISWVRLFFVCRVPSPHVQLSHEHASYEWRGLQSVDSIADFPLLHEALRYMTEHYVLEDL